MFDLFVAGFVGVCGCRLVCLLKRTCSACLRELFALALYVGVCLMT